MCDSSLEIFKTRTFMLDKDESKSLVLHDDGGDMTFSFTLRYIEDDDGIVDFDVEDEFHASFILSIRKNSISKWSEPMKIGKCNGDHDLYADVTVEPVAGDTYRITVNFLQNR